MLSHSCLFRKDPAKYGKEMNLRCHKCTFIKIEFTVDSTKQNRIDKEALKRSRNICMVMAFIICLWSSVLSCSGGWICGTVSFIQSRARHRVLKKIFQLIQALPAFPRYSVKCYCKCNKGFITREHDKTLFHKWPCLHPSSHRSWSFPSYLAFITMKSVLRPYGTTTVH